MKKILMMAFVLICTLPVLAQNVEYEENGHALPPYNFIGIQGGIQNTFNDEFNNWKTFTPTASVSFGRYFNPVVGARLHVNGIWDKSGVNYLLKDDDHYKYNYVTTDIDALVNLCTLFGKKKWYPVNLIFVGGLGVNYAFENYYRSEEKAFASDMCYADNDDRWAANGRVGLILDIPITRWLSFNLEADLNARFSRPHVFNNDMLQFLGQAGLNFKFGYKREKAAPVVLPVQRVVEQPKTEAKAEPKPEPKPKQYRTRIDTTWYDDVTYKDVTAPRDIKKEIFFGLAKDGINQDDAQINAVAEFLKGVKDGEVTITSYADKGTGNPTVNMRYSKQRAEKTRQALINKGVNPKMIKKVEWKGDTVQPYADNDKNRLSVITGHGIFTDKEKVVTKKFRTKEVKEEIK